MTLQEHLKSLPERFDKEFVCVDKEGDLIVASYERNPEDDENFSYWRDYKVRDFILQSNKETLTKVIEMIEQRFGKCQDYDKDCIVCQMNDIISELNSLIK